MRLAVKPGEAPTTHDLVHRANDHGPRVLIVDDDAEFAEGLADILESHGYSVAVAHSAEQARSIIEDFDASVGLVDIRLGTEDGLDLLADLKQARPGICCVAISAYADLESAIRAVHEGAREYLRKPLAGRDLLMTVERCFEMVLLRTAKAAVEEGLRNANERLEALARTDPLTGLPNRRHLCEALEQELARIGRYGGRLALVTVDVDDLKALNDSFGHQTGDLALLETASSLRREARQADFVARLSGDEFVVLMPQTTAEGAVIAAEQLRKTIADQVVSDGKRTVRFTVSAGVSAAEGSDGADPSTLLRLSDVALYAAKRAGRNCVRAWRDIHQEEVTTGDAAGARRVEDFRKQIVELTYCARDASIQGIWSLIRALEARDQYTKDHSENVTRYAVGLAKTMGLAAEEVEILRRAAMVHDIGKIGVPDSILQKPGPLTKQERRVMQSHVLVGIHILQEIRLLEREIPLIRCHHERWDGQGYPHRVSGPEMPLGATILSVADALDAITSNRVYRAARDLSDALRIITEASESQFAPAPVDALGRWVRQTSISLGCDGTLTAEDLLKTQGDATAMDAIIIPPGWPRACARTDTAGDDASLSPAEEGILIKPPDLNDSLRIPDDVPKPKEASAHEQ